MLPITDVARSLGLGPDDLELHGSHVAKISEAGLARAPRPNGKLVLVTSMTPTAAGEGKTTTTIGLADGLRRIGKRVVATIRQGSLGPTFGIKGGAEGGGKAKVVPADKVGLHLTGDFHAISIAHNLGAAFLDNHLHHGNVLGIDGRRVMWPRVMDLNDRALRSVVIGLGGAADGVPREARFEITPASEVMAILALANDLPDLRARIDRAVVAQRHDGSFVTMGDIGATGPMTVLLRDALKPNLLQTLEGTPVLVHAGPFANIAHGCSSVVADRLALGLADVVCTEAGFGADLGGEKFVNLKCRQSGLTPHAAVVVVTCRALKSHGDGLTVASGAGNLEKQLENVRRLGLPCVVAINRFPDDTDHELGELVRIARRAGAVDAVVAESFARGGEGMEDLARALVKLLEAPAPAPTWLYASDASLFDKMEAISRGMYGASGVDLEHGVRKRLDDLESAGYGKLGVCMAKTPFSLSGDAKLRGRPSDFRIKISDVRLLAGAGFVTALVGNVNLMPGLPTKPRDMDIA